MVGEDVGEILDPLTCRCLDPGRGRPVLARAGGTRNLRVGDVAHERVPEGVFRLPLDRAPPCRPHELLPSELVERQLDLVLAAVAHRDERTRPEHLAEHRGVLEEALAIRRERVETRCDQGVHALRKLRGLRSLREPALRDEPDELLCVQRVAARPLEDRTAHRTGHGLVQEAFHELARLVLRQRRQVDRVRVPHAGAPRRVGLEQLRTGRAEEQQRHAVGPLREVRQEIEHRRIGPVEVLDDDDRRSVGRDPLDETAPREERLVARGGVAGVDADERQEARLEPGTVLACGQDSLQLLRGSVRGVGLEDPRVRLHDLAERPERDSVAVREAPSLPPMDHLRPVVDVPEQLGAQPALSDPGLADERHELDARVTRAAVEEPLEQCLLHLASDEGRLPCPDQVGPEARPGLERPVEAHRLVLALDHGRLERLVDERPLRLPERLARDRDRVHGCDSLDPRGGVHDVARDHAFALFRPRIQRHERLPRGDPDPDLEPEPRVLRVQLLDRLEDAEGGPHRALGIVLVDGRRAEDRHHGVSDELLDGPAEALELLPQGCVVRPDAGPDVLGIGRLGRSRKADEVAEEHRDDLSLLARGGRGRAGQGGRALAAELRGTGVLEPARRADHGFSLRREPSAKGRYAGAAAGRSSSPNFARSTYWPKPGSTRSSPSSTTIVPRTSTVSTSPVTSVPS